MQNTKIRWTKHSWNYFSGCDEVSPGCDHCYARTIAEKFRGTAFPNGFDPTFKPQTLNQPMKLGGARIFVNSMSDMFHKTFTYDQIAAGFEVMRIADWHHYQILTKRPERAKVFIDRWLKETGLKYVPVHIWLGTSIESDKYAYRADVLREIPVHTKFISAEPLLEATPSLNLTDIRWLIVGGESGPGYRPMSHAWALELLEKARAAKDSNGHDMIFALSAEDVDRFDGKLWKPDSPDMNARPFGTGTAFYFKQSAAPRTEMGLELGGRRYEEYPVPEPEPVPPRVSKRVHWIGDLKRPWVVEDVPRGRLKMLPSNAE